MYLHKLILLLLACIILASSSQAKFYKTITSVETYIADADSNKESKVDYLEHIYFSGKNKDGLNTLILETLQDLEGTNTTQAVAVQYTFLSNIKATAANAKDACEIEDLLAVGIYNIDAREAEQQNIPMPSSESKAQAAAASNAAANAGRAIGSAATAGYYLSNGSSSLARTGAAVGGATYAARSISEVKNLFKGLGGSKDKPCKSVSEKNIEIGKHILPASDGKTKTLASKAEPVTLTITKVTFSQSKNIKANILTIKNVATIKNNSFSTNYLSMTIITDLPVSVLTDSIIIVNKNIPFEVTSQSGDEDNNKLIQLTINEDAIKNTDSVKDSKEKSYRDLSIIIHGITYEQSKELISDLEKTKGIQSLKTGGFNMAAIVIAVKTSISTDDVFEVIKKILPKLHFEVYAATENDLELIPSDNK